MHSYPRVDEILAQLEDVHLRLLRVCHDFPKDGNGTFCGEWIRNQCEQQGIPFHQGWLRKLANLGLLGRALTRPGAAIAATTESRTLPWFKEFLCCSLRSEPRSHQ